MRCFSCEFDNRSDSRICANCGEIINSTRRAVQKEKHILQCPFCKRVTEGNIRFCANCGRIFDVSKPVFVWNEEEKKEPVSTYTITVPPGSIYRKKWSQTIIHTLEINWRVAGTETVAAGLKDMITASVQLEIEAQFGHTVTRSVTNETEVELSGNVCSRYQLAWVDIWQAGTIRYYRDNTFALLPFRYRKWSDLEITPLQEK